MQPEIDPASPTPNPAAGPQSAVPTSPAPPERRHRLSTAAYSTATKLRPLLQLLESIQPQVASDSIFHTKRVKIQEEMTRAYGELLAEKPRHKALLHAFRTLSELVREETRDLSKDELKQAAREVVLATLMNAPQLISAAHQARLLA